MAQSGFIPIQLYSSPTPGASPAASNLTNGEIAINAADGKLFYKDTASNTQVIANSAWSSGVAVQGSGTNVVAAGTVQFANSNGVTFGLSGSTMTASVANQSVASYNIISASGNTAGTLTTFSSGTAVLAGGNNITLSQSSNTITINGGNNNVISAGGNTAGVLTTFGSGTVVLAGGNYITLSQSSNTITINGAGNNITVSAGTTSTATNNIVFASSNGISFGLTSNTVTAGSYQTYSEVRRQLDNISLGLATTAVISGSVNSYRNVIYPLVVNNTLSFQKIENVFSQTTSDPSPNYTYPMFAVATTALSASNIIATYEVEYYNVLYTKNVDTFSSASKLNNKASYIVQASFSTAPIGTGTASTRVSYTVSMTGTGSFATATSTNGLVYLTSSASITSATFAATSAPATITVASALNVGASNLAGIRNIPVMSSAPITLAPGTYWAIAGASSGATTATSGMTTLASAGTNPDVGGIFRVSNVVGTNSALQTNPLPYAGPATAAPVYGDYKNIIAYQNSVGSVFNTGYIGFTSGAALAASYASTDAAFSVNSASVTITAPAVTYR